MASSFKWYFQDRIVLALKSLHKRKKVVWLCPLCGEKEFIYGKSCKDYPACGGVLHGTGIRYITTDQTNSSSVGIAQISDE